MSYNTFNARFITIRLSSFILDFHINLNSFQTLKGLNESNESLINRVLNEIGGKMIENAINSTINMTTRDTKDGIADVISELLLTNRKVGLH